jgi:hypothetical protein
MKYAFVAIGACLLLTAGILFRDASTPPTVDQFAPVAEPEAPVSAVAEPSPATGDCPEPERNTAPRLKVSIACEGLRCRFDASATADDRGIRAWRWTFGQDVKNETAVTYEFPADGQYEVGVGAIDACGLADYRMMTVEVAAAEPFSCVDCPAAREAGASKFLRRSKAQGAASQFPRQHRGFSGASAQPSPDPDAAAEPGPAKDSLPAKD